MQKQQINIVWFKRDLRLTDHAPLAAAANANMPVLLLYLFEPSIMQHKTSDVRHWRYVYESISDLNAQLNPFQLKLYFAYADALFTFKNLAKYFQIHKVFSHEETGNNLTFNRDKEMANWFKQNQIQWQEFQCNGVIRRLKNRQQWPKLWHQYMSLPLVQPNLKSVKMPNVDNIVSQIFNDKDLPKEITQPHPNFQPGGAGNAHKYLKTFLNYRAVFYAKHISKPLLSRRSCSRLSPYLAYGNISIREVYQQTLHQIKLKTPRHAGLKFFLSRLHWHCHFIQKFETDCSIEFNNINPAFNAIRSEIDSDLVNKWQNAQTGYPLVDACMICLKETGFINFRMRAMVVSFFTHHLWQPWQSAAPILARWFLDYEPGIHYPQLQMQAATSGVNTIRTYNPVKQSIDHDSEGLFIKQWLPVLKNIPAKQVHQPWLLTNAEQAAYKCKLGVDYPFPIINLQETTKVVSAKLWEVKKSSEAKQYNKSVLRKFTSRRTEKEAPLKPPVLQTNNKNNGKDLNFKLFE